MPLPDGRRMLIKYISLLKDLNSWQFSSLIHISIIEKQLKLTEEI